MQPEVGKIYEGKVKGITKYGAFVEIAEGVTGMVHISEVANVFVSEIREHLTENQTVKVKVLNITDDGKISLSMKRAIENPAPQQKFQKNNNSQSRQRNNYSKPRQPENYSANPVEWEKKTSSNDSFEDMLSKFKQNSEEKMGDLKRNMEGKRRNTSRKGK